MSQPPRAQAHPGSGAAADAAPGTEGGARLAKVGDLLDAPNLAHFATVMPDGRPTSVPLWVGLEGEPASGPGATPGPGRRERHHRAPAGRPGRNAV